MDTTFFFCSHLLEMYRHTLRQLLGQMAKIDRCTPQTQLVHQQYSISRFPALSKVVIDDSKHNQGEYRSSHKDVPILCTDMQKESAETRSGDCNGF